MSEKQFVIYEMPPGNRSSRAITESELKKRIGLLREELTRAIPDYNECISILLHGEADSKPSTAHCPKCGRALSRCKCEAIKQAVEGKE